MPISTHPAGRLVRAALIVASAGLFSAPLGAQEGPHVLFEAVDEERGTGLIYFAEEDPTTGIYDVYARFVRFDAERFRTTGDIEALGTYHAVLLSGYEAQDWVHETYSWLVEDALERGVIISLNGRARTAYSPTLKGHQHRGGQVTEVSISILKILGDSEHKFAIWGQVPGDTSRIRIDVTEEEAVLFIGAVRTSIPAMSSYR